MRREKLHRVPKLPVALILLSAVFICLPIGVFQPVRSIASSILLWPRRVMASIMRRARGDTAEVEDLRGRVRLLERKIVQLSNEAAVGDRKIQELSRLNRMPTARGWGFITADIIGSDASVWGGTVEIDAGSTQGVTAGSGVVADGAVFGTVVEVHRWTSRVRRITDPGWTTAGMLAGKRVRGVVRGDGLGNCTVSYVVTQSLVEPGEKVVTSGMDGTFPRGMLIGTVTKCSWHKQGLAVNLNLEPAPGPSLAAKVVVLKSLQR